MPHVGSAAIRIGPVSSADIIRVTKPLLSFTSLFVVLVSFIALVHNWFFVLILVSSV